MPEELTLRDYFAAAVLTGQYSAVILEGAPHCAMYAGFDSPEKLAEACYKVADAMLKERERGGSEKGENVRG